MDKVKIVRSLAWASCLGLLGCAGGDQAAGDDVAEQRLLRDQADVASGLVDSIELGPNHSLKLFVRPDGTTLIGERAPIGTASALSQETAAGSTLEGIYAHLAPGRSLPAALRNVAQARSGAEASNVVPLTEGGSLWTAPVLDRNDDTAAVHSALSNTAADNTTFRNNFCPIGGASWCVVSWTGGRTSSSTSDHSIANVAFTQGAGSINLTLSGSNGAVFQTSVLPGEVQTWQGVGPTISVRDSGCLPLIACGTHPESKEVFQQWQVSNATGKVFDFGGRFYNVD